MLRVAPRVLCELGVRVDNRHFLDMSLFLPWAALNEQSSNALYFMNKVVDKKTRADCCQGSVSVSVSQNSRKNQHWVFGESRGARVFVLQVRRSGWSTCTRTTCSSRSPASRRASAQQRFRSSTSSRTSRSTSTAPQVPGSFSRAFLCEALASSLETNRICV